MFVVTCCGVLFGICVDDTTLRISSNVAIWAQVAIDRHRHRCHRRRRVVSLIAGFVPNSRLLVSVMEKCRGGFFKHQSNESVSRTSLVPIIVSQSNESVVI